MATDEANPLGGGLGGRMGDSGPAGGEPGAPSPGTSWAATTAVQSFVSTIRQAEKAVEGLIKKLNVAAGAGTTGPSSGGSYTAQHMQFGAWNIGSGPASRLPMDGQALAAKLPGSGDGWSWRRPISSFRNETDHAARLMIAQQAGNFAMAGLGGVRGYFQSLENQQYPLHWASARGGLLTGTSTNSFMDQATRLGGYRDAGDLTSALMITNRFQNPTMTMGSASRLGFINPALGMSGGAQALQQLMNPAVRHALAPFGGGLIGPGGQQRGLMDTLSQLGNVATRGQFSSMTAAEMRATFGIGGQGRASLLGAGVPEELVNALMDVGVGQATLGRPLRTRADLKEAGIGGSLLDSSLESSRARTMRETETLQSSEGTLRMFEGAAQTFADAVRRFVDNVPGAGAAGAIAGHAAGPLGGLAGNFWPLLAAGGLGRRVGAAGGAARAAGRVVGAAGGMGGLLKFAGKAGIVASLWGLANGDTDNPGNLPGWLGGADGRFFGIDGGTFSEGGNLGFLNPGNWIGDSVGDSGGAATGFGASGMGNMSPAQAEEIIRQRAGAPGQVAGLNPQLKVILASMMMENPRLRLVSGHRSYQEQEALFRSRFRPPAGRPNAPYREWHQVSGPPTAVPGTSKHETGMAVDLDDGTGSSRSWLRQNAPRFGLRNPFRNPNTEPWHWELPGAGGGQTASGTPAEEGSPAGAVAAGLSLVSGFGGIGTTSTSGRISSLLGGINLTEVTGGGSGGGGGGGVAGKLQSDGSIASIILSVGQRMGASPRVLLAALEAGIVESGLRNLNHGDRDSLGVFQQRPSQGWGTPEQIMNPSYAAEQFFKRAIALDSGFNGSAGDLAAAVQRPAARYRGRYQDNRSNAVGVASSLGLDLSSIGDSHGHSGGSGTSTSTSMSISAGRTIHIDRLVLEVRIDKVSDEEARRLAQRVKAFLVDDDALDRVGNH